MVPAGGYTTNLPVVRRRFNWWRWSMRGLGAFIILFILAVAWLAFTAPLSKSLQPPAPPSITLLDSDGKEIARRGAIIEKPVDAAQLPDHVREAFMAIEDRRFESHWGVDPRGIMRAFIHNISNDGGSQGGSTITQQLAKNAFLNSNRTAARKFQEVLISFWLEAWLTKNEIMSRYLSYVYFGDNVYGLRAAARHYFSVDVEDLTISQATMLAGLVQAPSRLAPTGNLKGARDRQKLVIAAMVDAGFLTKGEASDVRPAVLKVDKVKQLPSGGYFADWVLPQARDRAGEIATEQRVRTTLDSGMQRAAERAVRSAGLRETQIALVAMRPDGRVVAMVGGNSYAASPFNRATMARRQPGSTFKLFVYLAALRDGMTPDSMVDDTPLTIGDWSPENSGGRYSGRITLRQAFARSSNVAAVRLAQEVGIAKVIREARNLGISTPIGNEASIALGTSTVSLLELTAAYASIAEGSYPVRPRGLAENGEDQDWLSRQLGGPTGYPDRTLADMRSMLSGVVNGGTGRSANLSIPTFGKTGTTQNGQDALFVGYAGDLVVGVWVGNDDNSAIPGLSGGGMPARVWRTFMIDALDIPAVAAPPPLIDNVTEDDSPDLGDVIDGIISGSDVQTSVDTNPGNAPPPAPDDRRRDELTIPARPGVEDRGA
ncbi:transglycosylase domain-containing protein, partial [Sphingomonas sp. AOB5]|uniref:transglycosylase domain-containing protein n=1 Tax=Sphingomonas sp. AOB5 TaxID=3034017 RepID=UPI0023F89961